MVDEYITFEITVQPRDGDAYPLTVFSPRGGDARGRLRLPGNDAGYQQLVARLRALDTDEAALIALGSTLFNALFQGQVKEVYTRTQGGLAPNEGMRIRLEIAAEEGEVAALPWEFLYDPDQGPLVMLDAPIVRYIPQAAAVPTLKASLPLKVLLTAAQTPPPTQVQRELQEVEAALAALGSHVQITVEPHLTRSKLQRLLRSGEHQIWHFVGHGSFSHDGHTGQLIFEDASGAPEPVSAVELGILFNRSNVRLAVLDACNSAELATDPFRSMAPALIRNRVPAVIAMQFTVPEEATRVFAGEFYRALAEGYPIDACVTEGRRAVMGATGLGQPDWGIPVVYTRAPDGKLFELPKEAPPAQPAGGVHISVGPNATLQGSPISVSQVGTITKADDLALRRQQLDEHIRKLRQRLHQRQVQKAIYGFNADPVIIIEIEEIQKQIDQAERELAALGG